MGHFCRFTIANPLESLPRPTILCWERQNGPSYWSRGRERPNDTHCILHYCLSGRGRIRYRDHYYDIHPGEGFLCVINDPDMDYFYPDDGNEEWSFLWFAYEKGESRSLTREMNDRYTPVYELSPDSVPLRRFRQIRKDRENVLTLDAFEGAEIVYELLACLRKSRENWIQDQMPSFVRRAMHVAQESAYTPNVQQLADAVGVSREHLSRTFRNATGKSLKSYLLENCCRNAEIDLFSGERSIAEIAQLSGFSDAASFIRMFRKHTGVTPGEYRARQLRSISSVPDRSSAG